jgi:hypothetical protein
VTRKKKEPEPVPVDGRLLETARNSVARGLEIVNECIARAEAMLKKQAAKKTPTYDVKLASHVAWLTEKLALVVRELRQLENHERDREPELTEEQAIANLIEAGWTPPPH